jgi:hypothetical protein
MRLSSPRTVALFVVLASALWSTQVGAAITIAHQPIECVPAVNFSVIEAGFDPADQVNTARLFFRAKGTADWYFADFASGATAWSVILPQPEPTTEGIDYFVAATDREPREYRSGEYHPVVARSGSCERRAAGALPAGSAASLTIGLTRDGQAAQPPGFLAAGIASIQLVSGALVAFDAASGAGGTAAAQSGAAGTGTGATTGQSAAAAGAAGKGSSTLLYVLAGVGGAGLVAAAAGGSGGGNDAQPTATRAPTLPPTATATVTVAPTATPTVTPRAPTVTPTVTARPPTAVPTATRPPAVTASPTPPLRTPTATRTPTPRPRTATATPVITPTRTATRTATRTPTRTPTLLPTPSAQVCIRMSWNATNIQNPTLRLQEYPSGFLFTASNPGPSPLGGILDTSHGNQTCTVRTNTYEEVCWPSDPCALGAGLLFWGYHDNLVCDVMCSVSLVFQVRVGGVVTYTWSAQPWTYNPAGYCTTPTLGHCPM